jgi:hypothetical protein
LKVSYFYRNIKKFKKVGVMLGDYDKEKVKNIEKWPLLQAYGL